MRYLTLILLLTSFCVASQKTPRTDKQDQCNGNELLSGVLVSSEERKELLKLDFSLPDNPLIFRESPNAIKILSEKVYLYPSGLKKMSSVVEEYSSKNSSNEDVKKFITVLVSAKRKALNYLVSELGSADLESQLKAIPLLRELSLDSDVSLEAVGALFNWLTPTASQPLYEALETALKGVIGDLESEISQLYDSWLPKGLREEKIKRLRQSIEHVKKENQAKLGLRISKLASEIWQTSPSVQSENDKSILARLIDKLKRADETIDDHKIRAYFHVQNQEFDYLHNPKEEDLSRLRTYASVAISFIQFLARHPSDGDARLKHQILLNDYLERANLTAPAVQKDLALKKQQSQVANLMDALKHYFLLDMADELDKYLTSLKKKGVDLRAFPLVEAAEKNQAPDVLELLTKKYGLKKLSESGS
ncbi:MAG: hypothetical protein AB7F43_00750 [Bacteriovoracia bacterium]